MVDGSWLVTAKPINAGPYTPVGRQPVTFVQLLHPMLEQTDASATNAATDDPRLVSRRYTGYACEVLLRKSVLPPCENRPMNSVAPSGLMSKTMCGDDGSTDFRIMRPAWAKAAAAVWDRTNA